VTHMPLTFKDIQFLTPFNQIEFDTIREVHAKEIFSQETMKFLVAWSDKLLKHPSTRRFPDVATFAFYIRKGNLSQLAKQFIKEDQISLGKGVAFHIAPGNVPVNFAYSLIAGLLSGNINIVKVPSKHFEQVDLLINVLNDLISNSEFESFRKQIILVRYSRDSKATEYFSSICDVRIIWGGDNTIQEIRKNAIPPRSTEITFADRYSIAVIDSSSYINYGEKQKLALDFYNDTYLFDQNACTSPNLIFWKGSEILNEEAQVIFWSELEKVLNLKQFELQPVLAVDKLTNFYLQAAHYGDVHKYTIGGNDIWRVNNDSIPMNIEYFRCSSGYFNEFNISSLKQIAPIINRRYQTLAYFGIAKNEIQQFILDEKVNGIDRIVPIGRTMDFSLIWDGYNLISSLSRIVY